METALENDNIVNCRWRNFKIQGFNELLENHANISYPDWQYLGQILGSYESEIIKLSLFWNLLLLLAARMMEEEYNVLSIHELILVSRCKCTVNK